MPSIANIVGTDLSAYKVVYKGQFAYGPVTSRNGDKISVALLREENAIISQAYEVFEVVDANALDPEYLMMWFRRPEFDRYARFHSHGSAREVFDWEEMCEVKIPVPTIEEQRCIVAEYNTIQKRIATNKKLIETLEQTAQTLYRKTFIDNIDPNNLPAGWRMGTIGEFCDIITGKKDVNESLEKGKYRFFSCSPDFYFSNEYIACGPAVLIAGNGSYTGRVTYYDKEFDLYQRTYACLPKVFSRTIMSFLYGVLKFQFEAKFMGGSRGSSIPYIVRGDIADFEFPYNMDKCQFFSNEMNKIQAFIQFKANETIIMEKMQTLLLSKMGV